MNDFLYPVDISSYNSADNKYTFPVDGYLYILSGYTSGNTTGGVLFGNDVNYSMSVSAEASSANHAVQNLFVRKGMKFYTSVKASTGSIRFIPFN